MAKKSLTFDADDVGITLECTLVFTDFDPTGGTAVLEVTGQADRAMTLTGPYSDVATYVVPAGDFKPGYYEAQVRVSKGGVTISSESFLIVVTD